MCGIVGVLDPVPGGVDPALLVLMRDTMTHRGPDDAGVYLSPDQTLGLGSRRLNIIDLSPAGHQPMANEDGTIWIVFNGEVYNHADLRQDLEARGHRYRSRTDTETVLHLYEERGEACVRDLRGMFAFAIWDAPQRRLFLARDRIGIKPLYYTVHNGRFLFASEIKAIIADPAVSRDVNPEALYHYLTFLTTPPPQTLFQGIRKLPAGFTLTVDARGQMRSAQYWDAIIPATGQGISEEACAREIRRLLFEAVDLWKMSDVPYGVFLSGGIDSSVNVAILAALLDRPVETFTVGFKGQESYNELQYARQVADLFKTNHHEVLIDHGDLVDFLPKLVYHQDEPIADPVCVPLYFVSKLAKDHGVTVIQVGEGSDELFCGYPHYLNTLRFHERVWRRLRSLPLPVRRATFLGASTLSRLLRRGFHLRDDVRKAIADEELFWGGAIVFTESDKAHLLARQYQMTLDGVSSYQIIKPFYDRIGQIKPQADALERMIYLELKLRLPELLLMRVDKITMATSVEARVPFLDHKLVEFAMPIPSAIKVKDQTKYILKQAVRGLIPDEIIFRKKQGFGAPIREWFFEAMGGYLREALLRSSLRERGYFDYAYVQRILEAHLDGRADYSPFLWNLLNLSLWHDYWIAGKGI